MINKPSIDLIKSFEACKLKAYECPTSLAFTTKSKKFFTIGWGNTYYENGNKIKQKDVITQQRADELFEYTLNEFEKEVTKLVRVKLTDNQLGALVSFAYNTGMGNFGSSTLLKKVNAKDFAGASGEFGKWVKGGGKVLNGLVTRRKREAELFMAA
jgi:lysozyme